MLAGPLSFMLCAGQRVALVGQSGAGKSILLNLLSGFLPYRGELRINGLEMRDLDPTHWYTQLSWVGQNPHLPGATIRGNILPIGNEAEDERLQTILGDAGVSEFLPLLENGIDSTLGDNASRLSIGQAQRVAVARTLLPQCRLLLLDEPVASLDAHSEHRVMQALTQGSRQQTTLMVTHQLDDIIDWDTIWVMRHGQIVEQGNFATLSKANGPFATLRTHRQEEI